MWLARERAALSEMVGFTPAIFVCARVQFGTSAANQSSRTLAVSVRLRGLTSDVKAWTRHHARLRLHSASGSDVSMEHASS